MKTISTIGLVLGVLLFAVAMYLQFSLAPHAEYLEGSVYVNGELNRELADIQMAASDMKLNVAYACLLGGGIAFIMCLIGFLKTKNKMALLGALLALGATFIGIIQGTHMFS